MLSPETEDRDEVEAANWGKHKKTFYYSVFELKHT
jgi:hypothetical protein